MRLWLFIWIAIGALTLEFVNADGSSSDFSSTLDTEIITISSDSDGLTTTRNTEGPNPTGNTDEPYTGSTVSTASENASPVTVQSTIEQTTTVQQTTAEQIWAGQLTDKFYFFNSDLSEFIVDCDSVEGYCYYNITAPFVLPGGANNVSKEKESYLRASAATYQIDSDFFNSPLYSNYSELVELFHETKRFGYLDNKY